MNGNLFLKRRMMGYSSATKMSANNMTTNGGYVMDPLI